VEAVVIMPRKTSRLLAFETALAKRITKAREETLKKAPEETPGDGLLTRPLGGQIDEIEVMRLVEYAEASWYGHQDTYVFRRESAWASTGRRLGGSRS
jgi:hypothetical protein